MAELTGAEETGIGARPYPQGAVMNLCADTESLQRDTGFVPEYTFEEGIRETIAWIRSQETGVWNKNEEKNFGGNSHLQ